MATRCRFSHRSTGGSPARFTREGGSSQQSLREEGEAQVLSAARRLLGRGSPIKVYCHLCGATLRHPSQYQPLAAGAGREPVFVCRDEQRCQLRAERDPITGKPRPSAIARADASGAAN
jgi:hypothetical protein